MQDEWAELWLRAPGLDPQWSVGTPYAFGRKATDPSSSLLAKVAEILKSMCLIFFPFAGAQLLKSSESSKCYLFIRKGVEARGFHLVRMN
jgi:hypothetical protein